MVCKSQTLETNQELLHDPLIAVESEPMEFRLQYRGPLPSAQATNAIKTSKHRIRKVVHKQLVHLWKGKELQALHNRTQSPDARTYAENLGAEFSVGPFNFVPLVTERLRLVSHLDILFLRREGTGSLISKPKDVYGGDLDNRLKIFLDALRVPLSIDELPTGIGPDANEQPYFYCLLEDDSLITKIQVEADKLLGDVTLDEVASGGSSMTDWEKNVHLVVKVTTRAVIFTLANMGLPELL